MKPRLGAFLPAILCLALLAPAGQGLTQEEKSQQTRLVESLSEKVHRLLSKAQEAMEAEDYAAAEGLLGEITELRNLSPYELAHANRFYGFIHLAREDYDAAIQAFRRIVEANGPDVIAGIYDETIWTLAQLYMQVENYAEAVNYARQWLDSQENPAPRQQVILAMAHYQLGQWREALDVLTLAIDNAQAAGVPVEENWWRYVVAVHWELEQFPEALDVTRILLAQWPRKSHWNQLQGLYGIVEDEPRQLAAFWCMYDQGLLKTNSELVGMAQLFMLAENPYKAAVILEEGLNDGSIEKEAVNYRVQAQAWQFAREDRKALAPLRKAAELEEDAKERGVLYLRLAEAHNALSEHGQCAGAARQALRTGELKSEGRAYMLLGQCLLEQEEFDEAGEAFSRATRDSDTRRLATRWRTHVTREVARRQELERKLAQAQ